MQNQKLIPSFLTIGFIFLFSFSAFAQGTWTQLPSFPGVARGLAVSFVIGNKAYVGTGRTPGPTSLKDFWEFDGVSQVWTQKADYDTLCFDATGFVIGSKGYVGTGMYSSFSLPYFFEYDPATNVWTPKADFPNKRDKAIGFSLNNKGYIGTGHNETGGSQYTFDLWEYDATADTWTIKDTMCGAAYRQCAATFNLNGNQYVGFGAYSLVLDRKDLWQYNSSTDTWTQKANFPGTGRRNVSSFVIGNYGYVGMGFTSSNTNIDFYKYDPIANSWSSIPDFPGTDRGGAVSFSIGNVGYVMGGYYFGSSYNDFWMYDPNGCVVTSGFSASDTMVLAGTSISFTNTSVNATSYSWLINGTQFSTSNNPTYNFTTPGSYTVSLLAVGPCTDTFSVNISVETVCWTNINSYPPGGRRGSVAFSIGGKGYVGTGTSNFFDYKDDFYEYDPVTDNWTQKSAMSMGRVNAAAFSIGTDGYIGTGYNGVVLKDFWQWNQTTNTWTQKADFAGVAREYATAFSVNGKGYLGMGTNLPLLVYYNDFYEYDPTLNVWTSKASYPGLSRYACVGLSAGNKGYSALGLNGTNSTKEFYEYDPAADSWTQRTDFPGPAAAFATGFSIGTQNYVLVEASTFTSVCYMWDPVTNVWTQQQEFTGSPRQGAVGFSIGNSGYVGTGELSSGLSSDFWKFDCGINGIDDSNSENQKLIFANPNNGMFSVQYPYQWSNGKLLIMDVTGKEVAKIKLNRGSTITPININFVEDGIYYYSVVSDNAVKTSGKIIILKE